MDLNQSDWKLQCETNENSIIIDVRTEHELLKELSQMQLILISMEVNYL